MTTALERPGAKILTQKRSSDGMVTSEEDCKPCVWYKRTARWDYKSCVIGCKGGPILLEDRHTITRKLLSLGVRHFNNPEIMVATEVGLPVPWAGRVDIFVMNREGEIRIAEVKSCREDFTSDKKWKFYLKYCDFFYFIAPAHAITPSDLPKEIGLLQPTRPEDKEALKSKDINEWGSLYVVRKPRRLNQIELYTRFYMMRKLAYLNNKVVDVRCRKCGRATQTVKSYSGSPTLKFKLVEKGGNWGYEMWNHELHINIKPAYLYPSKEEARARVLLVCDKLCSNPQELF